MAATDNLAKLKHAYAEWDRTKGGSIDVWRALLDPNIKVRSLAAGRDPSGFTQNVNGAADMQRYWKLLLDDWEMVSYRTDHFMVDGDRVAMQGEVAFTFKKTGKTVKTPKADFWTFKDGKAVAYYEYYDTAAMLAATQP